MSLEARNLSRSASTEDMASEMTHVDAPWFAGEAYFMEAPASSLNLLDLVQGSLALQGHLSISSAGASRRTAAMSVNGPHNQPSVTQASPFAYVAANSSCMDVEEACGRDGPWIARSKPAIGMVPITKQVEFWGTWSPNYAALQVGPEQQCPTLQIGLQHLTESY